MNNDHLIQYWVLYQLKLKLVMSLCVMMLSIHTLMVLKLPTGWVFLLLKKY